MHIIEVAPLISIPKSQNQTFSYFWPEALNTGDLIFAPVRNKKTLAIVLGSTPLAKQKIMLKKMAGFALKRLAGVKKQNVATKQQIEIAVWLSDYYFAPLGLCLKLILPKFWKSKNYSARQNQPETNHTKETLFINDDIKRYSDYINKTGQTLILVPQKVSIPIIQSELSKYPSVAIHGNLSLKDQYKAYQDIQTGTPLIIGTRAALFYDYPNLKSIIVHDAGNGSYYSDMTPKYLAPNVAKKLAQMTNSSLIFTGFPFLDLFHPDPQQSFFQIKKSDSDLEIADMVKEIQHGNFSFLSQTLIRKLEAGLNNNDRLIIFSHRKGYALYICKACGKTVNCENCSIAMTIHVENDESHLLCHRCQNQKPIPKFCPSCQNYALKTYGFGSERIAKEIKKILPNLEIFLLDQEHIKEESGLSIIKKWLEKPSVLIATSMLFSFKDLIAEASENLKITSAIFGLDQLMQLPDFRMNNKILREVYLIRSLSNQTVIQTIDAKTDLINTITSQTYAESLRKDLNDRLMMRYPPFGQIIKIESKNISQERASYQAQNLMHQLKKLPPELTGNAQMLGPVPALISKEKGKYIYNSLIKIPKRKLETVKKSQFLNAVGPGFEIVVDPKNPL